MFDLEEIYTSLQTDPTLFHGTEPLSSQLHAELINSPSVILNDEVWERALMELCPPPGTPPDQCDQVVEIIINSLESIQRVSINASNEEILREQIEKYFFLARLNIARLDADIANTEVKLNRAKLGNSGDQCKRLIDAIASLVQSSLSLLYPSNMANKRSSLALLYLEPCCKLLQHPATCANANLSNAIVDLMCLGVKLQHQQSMVKTELLQLLTYYQHAVPVTTKFLVKLSADFDHTSLAEQLLLSLCQEASKWKEGQANLARAKVVNEFLVALSLSLPRLFVSNLNAISILLSSPFSKLRLGTVEVAPQIIKTILQSEQDELNLSQFKLGVDGEKKPAFELVKLIAPRTNDANHFVRAKTLSALSEICKEPSMISLRLDFSEIAFKKMMDKSLYVRRQAMLFMKQLIDSHPQLMHKKNLNKQVWTKSLAEIDSELLKVSPDQPVFQQLEAGKAFVEFTIKFIKIVEDALKMAQSLLNSRSKTDILDAISLLVYGDAYQVEASELGIRSIVHLVWTKADNDENNQVSQTAVDTYSTLFLQTSPDLNERQSAQKIADNLIYLTLNANNGMLTSLEQLLVLAMERQLIPLPVISRLWGIYQTNKDVDFKKRRGAAIVLGMLSLQDNTIAKSGIGAIMNAGLKNYCAGDYIYAANSFIILKRSLQLNENRLPPNYELFDAIVEFLTLPAPERRGMAWMLMAKEALSAIVMMCASPSKVYTKLIKRFMQLVFVKQRSNHTPSQRAQLFVQLIYVVGEVAINLLVFCERLELEFKRKNQTPDKEKEQEDEEEMMAGGGSLDDDFQDILKEFRENIIFYSDKSLLKPFTGMVVDICKCELVLNYTPEAAKKLSPDIRDTILDVLNNTPPQPEFIKQFTNTNNLLTICATQTLSKFMCVSSKFCAEQIPLLVSLMTIHKSNVVRSNFVVALGDVAICFNQLIDLHTHYLYDRLNDHEEVVQRTCIVALTFLILAGQIKVKGKMGEIAKVIVHENKKISALAKMFFNELSTKENAIYNSYLDILSTLIADTGLTTSKMNTIIRFITQRLDKEKQMKKLTDKLVLRMKRAENEREFAAIVHGINSMKRKPEDDIVKLIQQGYKRVPGDEQEGEVEGEEQVEEDEQDEMQVEGDEMDVE